jgi:hypothetical protein
MQNLFDNMKRKITGAYIVANIYVCSYSGPKFGCWADVVLVRPTLQNNRLPYSNWWWNTRLRCSDGYCSLLNRTEKRKKGHSLALSQACPEKTTITLKIFPLWKDFQNEDARDIEKKNIIPVWCFSMRKDSMEYWWNRPKSLVERHVIDKLC